MAFIAIDRNHTRAELLRLGFDDDEISRACRVGEIDRIGVGLYGPAGSASSTREEAHRQRAILWARQVRERGFSTTSRALAEVSAAAVLGFPLWGLPLAQVAG